MEQDVYVFHSDQEPYSPLEYLNVCNQNGKTDIQNVITKTTKILRAGIEYLVRDARKHFLQIFRTRKPTPLGVG